MKGLLKNNFYASLSNMKFFSIMMLLAGAFVIVVDNDVTTLLTGYVLISMVGFPVNSIACLQKENSSKWRKYKLTVPVRRVDIVRSYFISQLIWLLAGILAAGVCLGLSISLHGFPFDRNMDIVMLFVAGISVSLLMNAFFFFLYFIGNDERSEAVLIISLLCAIGIVMVLVSAVNWVLGKDLSLLQLLIGAAVILFTSVLIFGLSYPLTVGAFKNRKY